MKKKATIALISFGVAWALLAQPATAEGEGSPAGDGVAGEPFIILDDGVLLDTDPLATDAAFFADEIGVSQAEAEYRLHAQEEYAPLVAELRRLAGDQSAGVYYEQEPAFVIVVRIMGLKETAPEELLSTISRSTAPVRIEYGAPHSEDDLNRAHTQIDWREILPEWNGSYTDVRVGTLNLGVLVEGERTETTVKDLLASLESGSSVKAELLEAVGDVPVILEHHGALDMLNRGGRILSLPGTNPQCTSGFTVQNSSGTRGMVTAGHCGAGLRYHWFSGGGPFAMTLQARTPSGYSDLAWHTTSAQSIEALFHTSPTLARNQVGQGSGVVGQYLCRWGVAGGYGCNQIVSITHAPPLCDSNDPCAPVFSLTNAGCTAVSGDSGGPWFIGNTPHGITSGKYTVVDQCFFSRVWYLQNSPSLNVTLLGS